MKTQSVTLETYLAQNGASRQDYGDAGLHRSSANVSGRAKIAAIRHQHAQDMALDGRRIALTREYWAKVQAGEIEPPTRIERLQAIANGHEDRDDTQAARRALANMGLTW